MSSGTSESPTAPLQAISGSTHQLDARNVFLATQRPKEAPLVHRLNPTADLRLKFTDADSDALKYFATLTPVEYAPGRTVSAGHVMYAANSEIPLLSDLRLDERDGSEMTPGFEPTTFPFRHLKLTITSYRWSATAPAPESCTCFRITRQSAVLQRSGKIAAFFDGGVFTSLESEVLMFDSGVDAVSVGGYTFFTNAYSFSTAFQFLQQMKDAASQTFETVTKDIRIEGLEALRIAATNGMPMISKMASIQRKLDSLPEYAAALTMPNLLHFIDAHPHVEVELSGEGDDRRFVFSNSPTQRFKILKLLDDDYLTSALTNFEYSVDSKGAPTRNS